MAKEKIFAQFSHKESAQKLHTQKYMKCKQN